MLLLLLMLLLMMLQLLILMKLLLKSRLKLTSILDLECHLPAWTLGFILILQTIVLIFVELKIFGCGTMCS